MSNRVFSAINITYKNGTVFRFTSGEQQLEQIMRDFHNYLNHPVNAPNGGRYSHVINEEGVTVSVLINFQFVASIEQLPTVNNLTLPTS